MGSTPDQRPLARPAQTGERYIEPLEHEEVLIRRGRGRGCSRLRGAFEGSRTGTRGLPDVVYEDSPAALRDVLRLSRAMTFKAAVANLPLGGGKGVIMVPAAGMLTRERRHAALLDFGGHRASARQAATSPRRTSASPAGTWA